MPSPKLRFPQYNSKIASVPLSDIVERVTRKNKDNITDLPLTISSLDGLVDQRTYFNKAVASKDMSGYYLLQKGEFAYNKSYSAGYDYGSIKRLDKYDCGALSTLYICFKVKNEAISDYMVKYFDSLKWNEEVAEICAEGARNHGLLNVPVNGFFDIQINITEDKNEQDDIVSFLNLVDSKIEIQKKMVSSLEQQKTGVIQKIFDHEITLHDENGIPFPKWNSIPFGDLVENYTNKSKVENEDTLLSCAIEGMYLNSELFGHQRGSSNVGYSKIEKGDLILSAQNLHLGNANVNMRFDHGIISPAYKTYHITGCTPEFMAIWVKREYAKKFFFDATTAGASQCRRNVIWEQIYSQTIEVPCEPEQNKISEIVELLDKKITIEREISDKWQLLKKGLLQQMFI